MAHTNTLSGVGPRRVTPCLIGSMSASTILAATLMTIFGAGLSACSGTEPVPDAGSEPEPDPLPVYLNIRFDYRYDAAGFFRPERRAVLEEAGAAWGRLLADDLDAVPAGTPLLTRNPTDPTLPAESIFLDEEIDDVVIFVATADLGGIGGTTARAFPTAELNVGDDALQAELTERYDGARFQPWSGWIAFDSNELWYADDDVDSVGDLPSQGTDLYSTAMHEIAHVLGIGTSAAWAAQVNDAGEFDGANAAALFGAPVPLSGNETHVDDSVLFEGERVLMDVTDPAGTRVFPSALDLAMLQDVGWTLVE